MTRMRLAAFYQDTAYRYAGGAVEAREKTETYRRSWFWRKSGLVEAWLKRWDECATLAEAYALTARMLMGLEE